MKIWNDIAWNLSWIQIELNWVEISLKRNGIQISEEYGVRFLFIFKQKFEITLFHASLFAISKKNF
jgi:hypothetical protein